MRAVHLSRCVLVVLLLLAVWNAGQAQDSLGMSCVSGLEYWQQVDDIRMVGNLAYIVAGTSGLHIVDLSDPANPLEIGRFTWYQMSETGGHFYVLGNLLYLGIETGGFVLDVSDPTHPVVLGQWTSTIGCGISFAHDGYAIAHNEEGYPYVLDISDPTNVHYIGEIPHSGPQRGVGVAGEYLCMTGNPGGLVLFDMSNPAEPQWVASIDTSFGTYSATISGSYAYLATQYNGLRIIDLSNPLQPVEISTCDSIGWTYDVTVMGSHAVLLKGTSTEVWLNIWNVADPAHPTFEGTIPASIYGWYIVSSSENLVCTAMAGPYEAVMVVDISNPGVPVEVSSFGSKGKIIHSAISNTVVCLADYRTGLLTVDITNPHDISELGHADRIDNRGTDVAIRGDYAYVIENFYSSFTDPIVVFDISNPAEPESVGCALYDNAYRIAIEGEYAYVARLFQIATYSLANPALPQCVNVLDMPSGDIGLGLAARNGYLYYGSGSSFYICSLSNPAAPELVGLCSVGGGGYVVDIAVAGDYAYVANGYGGMRIIDIENPVHPSQANWVNGYWVSSVAASGNIAIMDDLTRISIYDVTYPDDLRLVGYYPTYERITDMEIRGQYLFTTSISEFRVYECDALSATPPHPVIIPYEFDLLPPYPNPFNSILTIPFTLPIQSESIITIHNILGQKVHQFAFPPLSPGAHRVIWNAESCASGLYIIQLISGEKEFKQKVVLLK